MSAILAEPTALGAPVTATRGDAARPTQPVLKLRGWRVATRIQFLVAMTVLGLAALCAASLVHLRANLVDDRRAHVQGVVEMALGVVAQYNRLAEEGKMTQEAARAAAREALRGARYGKGDYVFIVDTNHVYVMFPPKPENEGKNIRDLKDANGKLFVQDLVSQGVAGGGFTDYWFPRPGNPAPKPKLSYTRAFAPWGWVVGTGIYIDDVDEEFWQTALILGGLSAGLVALLVFAGWRIGTSIVGQLGGEPGEAAAFMRRVSSGDLAADVGRRPAGSLLASLGEMIGSLRELVASLERQSHELARDAEAIRTASHEVSQAAEQQSDATSAMAAAVEELTVSSTHISESARETEADSNDSREWAVRGRERVDRAGAAIGKVADIVSGASGRIRDLERGAQKVSTIAAVIKEIAAQTNLLALNAAIEASRAGEQGRGFAVVADEVRKLAERTAEATTEIETMIAGVQNETVAAVQAMDAALPEVRGGVDLARDATESLRTIEEGATRTLGRVRDVAGATQEQASAATSIAQRVEQIAQMVTENSAAARGTADTAARLEGIARSLEQEMARFRL